jgi:hypothetical protein
MTAHQIFLWTPATAFALVPTLCTCEECLAAGLRRAGDGLQLQLCLVADENGAPASSPASAPALSAFAQPETVHDC